MGMTNSDWKQAYNLVCEDRDHMRSAHGKAVDRIRELESELAEALEKTDKLVLEAQRGEKMAVDKLVDLRRELVETKAELQVRDDMGNEVLRILREATGRRDFHSEMEAAEHAAKMLAEARLDRARMDWLELQVGSDNVRAAIDAAMKEAK